MTSSSSKDSVITKIDVEGTGEFISMVNGNRWLLKIASWGIKAIKTYEGRGRVGGISSVAAKPQLLDDLDS